MQSKQLGVRRAGAVSMMALTAGVAALIWSGLAGANAPAAGGTERAPALDPVPSDPRPAYSPAVRNRHPEQVFFGNLHLHTRFSADSFILGEVNATPENAYRFAMGQMVQATNGLPTRLRRPLDFLAVSDHAEYMGLLSGVADGDEAALRTRLGARWDPLIREGRRLELIKEFAAALAGAGKEYRLPDDFRVSVWQRMARAADTFYQPGRFTTFAAYEWSSQPGGNNLHRVVLYKDGAGRTGKTRPFSSQDSDDPERLWAELDAYERDTGGSVLAIPHNSNLSNGMMFAPTTLSGKPLDADYARRRARWEPLIEVTQGKGDSEAHPFLSPNDEFADYERWDDYNIMNSAAKEDWMLKYEYARSALRLGLEYEASIGANPFKFGLIGSTDAHTGLSTTTQDNFFGKFPASEPSAERISRKIGDFLNANWMLSASGLTGIWAEENSRESLFAALKRREVYATTGTRTSVRFFGGWQFGARDVDRPDYADIGYAKGVPMGGDLGARGGSRAPSFMVLATKDPDGANLDRIQVIKGWLGADGRTHEKVYDVALSDGRAVDPRTGKAPPVGSTVNLADASYRNSIGAVQLATVWKDPDFDPAQRAFYYVRVLSIPIPRWTAYDAKYFGLKLPKEVPLTTTERAYTSPIWYAPAPRAS